ncbi:MAG TPA: ATP-binding protein [Gemmatimonadales bacterium]|nr:ATP-binding protein [Gemmatimonadales bacterium]
MSPGPVRVLLIEDNPGDARLTQELLQEATGTSFVVECVERLAPGLARLEAHPFAVVLLDLALPDSRGLETFAAVQSRAPETAIIVLTGLRDEALALTIVQLGAQDCLVKGKADGPLLARAIRYGIERHHGRQEIRRLNEELEQRVRQRTAQLEAANHELEAFTYSVSHDLRAPLRQVDGFVRMLLEELEGRLEPRTQHYLRRIEEGAHHMGRLVDDLLNLARVGRQAPRLHLTPLKGVVERVLAQLAPEWAERRIEWRIADDLPAVDCDPGLMAIVFTNLLSNAVKYTRRCEHACIEVGRTTHNGERVLFVKDNGVGFDMKYAGKLFGVFQRLHRPEDFEGTGVGLATVQRIIHKHGGRIWAEAEQDRGAAFYFTVGREAEM